MPTAPGAWSSPRCARLLQMQNIEHQACPIASSAEAVLPARLLLSPAACSATLHTLPVSLLCVQVLAEGHFPYLETQAGALLHITDHDGKPHAFRLRFWINNQSRCGSSARGGACPANAA